MTVTGVAGSYLSPEPVLEPGRDRACRVVAAGCVALAGAIHLWVVPEHLGEALRLGLFFLLVGVAQVGLAVALRSVLRTWVVLWAVLAHLAMVVLYVATRTVDLPFLPVHDHAEHEPIARTVGNGVPIFPGSRIEEVGALDLVCQGAELLAVVCLVALLPRRTGGRVVDLMLGLGLLAIALRVVGVLS